MSDDAPIPSKTCRRQIFSKSSFSALPYVRVSFFSTTIPPFGCFYLTPPGGDSGIVSVGNPFHNSVIINWRCEIHSVSTIFFYAFFICYCLKFRHILTVMQHCIEIFFIYAGFRLIGSTPARQRQNNFVYRLFSAVFVVLLII